MRARGSIRRGPSRGKFSAARENEGPEHGAQVPRFFMCCTDLPAVVVSSIAGSVGRAFASVPSSVACPLCRAFARFESTFARPRRVFAGPYACFVRSNSRLTRANGPRDAQIPRACIGTSDGRISLRVRPLPSCVLTRLGPRAGCIGAGTRGHFGVVRTGVVARAACRVSVATVAIDVGLTVKDRRRYGERNRKGGKEEKCSRTHRPSTGGDERRMTNPAAFDTGLGKTV